MVTNKMDFTEETINHRFGWKILAPTPRCYTLEVYDETPIFITMDITEDVVELVTEKLSGSSGTGVTDSEDLQRWLLKSGEDIKILFTSVEIIVDWISHKYTLGSLQVIYICPPYCARQKAGRFYSWHQGNLAMSFR